MIDRVGPRSNHKAIWETKTQAIKRRQEIDKTKKKRVDYFTVLASIDLKEKLVPDPNPVQPVPAPPDPACPIQQLQA